jgi:mannose-1-phosphate guanylyltransferase
MIIPIILSGGSGTRLWPLSRKLYPKQFINIVNETTLFQDTINRLPKEVSSPLIICNEEHRFIVAEQLRQIHSQNNGIILEPIGRNTAPAIAIGAMASLLKEDDPVILILSADHIIENKEQFSESVYTAEKIAKQGKIVALGIHPNKPETGYGYIKVKNSKKLSYQDIESFTEKPDFETAQSYLNSGNYLWNSGIFMFKASVYLNELKKFEPKIYKSCKESFQKTNNDLDFIRLDKKEFSKCPNKSIDYAIMEKTSLGVMVAFNGLWSDIGSWESIWNLKPKDLNNNVSIGDVSLTKVRNSYLHSTNRLMCISDIDDIVVIDTQDALLVTSKKSSQEIKHIVQKLQDANRNEAENHRKVFRPWGYYDSIDLGEGFQVKRIFVNPFSKLSLQKHSKRAEHWVIVKGVATITCGERNFKLNQNESTYIPKGEPHRLENSEKNPLEIIEIQTGTYFGEDDIIRIEDDYERH